MFRDKETQGVSGPHKVYSFKEAPPQVASRRPPAPVALKERVKEVSIITQLLDPLNIV